MLAQGQRSGHHGQSEVGGHQERTAPYPVGHCADHRSSERRQPQAQTDKRGQAVGGGERLHPDPGGEWTPDDTTCSQMYSRITTTMPPSLPSLDRPTFMTACETDVNVLAKQDPGK